MEQLLINLFQLNFSMLCVEVAVLIDRLDLRNFDTEFIQNLRKHYDMRITCSVDVKIPGVHKLDVKRLIIPCHMNPTLI